LYSPAHKQMHTPTQSDRGVKRRAVFLDRDGTLVHPYHYPSRPEHLRLFDGIEPELRRLQGAGFCLVVITNQSGLARGLFTEADLACMHDWLQHRLARASVHLDGIYYCPHHVEGSVPELSIACACRKPEPGMLLRAARDLGLDLARSWLVGDILDDVQAGNRAGCRTVLVDLGTEARPTESERTPGFVARDTVHALRIVQAMEGLGAGADLSYHPESWSSSQAVGAAGGRRG
jgi:D-glycero-D-manno-heptose 1,7-bisphosphate phosphatase